MTDKSQSKPPPPGELDQARKELEAASAATDIASKQHTDAVAGLKKTISDPKFRAVRLPTPSQLEVEPPAEKR